MPPLRSRMVDGPHKLLELTLKLANGFPSLGFGMIWACPYSYSLSLAPDHGFDSQGVLKDGRPYELTYTDVAVPEERGRGVSHYYISCRSGEEELGHMRMLYDNIFIDEFDTVVHFKGWYFFDAYVEPQARRLGILRKSVQYGLHLAKESDVDCRCALALTHVYNRPSRKALESMGFSRRPSIMYIKLFGQQQWLGMDNGRIG